MKFDDLDKQMRVFETADDYCVLPGVYMVARIDGRHFTRLTRDVLKLEAPFDVRFRDWMTGTVEHLMNCGFTFIYGYTQSDEISMLFQPDDKTFGRKTRKLNSVLAGEASGKFSILAGQPVAFDCRISQLPRESDVMDYFRWRSQDALRNALNAHCYWMLRKQGQSATRATTALLNKSIADKNELLFQNGINFNNVPDWQKRGVGLYWQFYIKDGFNPKTQETVKVLRKRLNNDYVLPVGDLYSAFIQARLYGGMDDKLKLDEAITA